ncbi:MAG: hypothetical protein H6797_02090 [Candidatus Nomurabacteria bacterium]|nr:MAG: hypothetical protein H6797_02090 [Candidatus Nomurabacteria bacterium]
MGLSRKEFKRQKEERLQRIEDIMFLLLFGYAAWICVWIVIGKAAVTTMHQHTVHPETISTFHDYVTVALFFVGGAVFAASVLWEPLKKLTFERTMLQADLLAKDRPKRLAIYK